jgi:Arc/MetJ-type ribon-helix-helix transcriptional regulator
MTIEITKPETEALIERHLRSGRFQDVDELLKKALVSLDEQTPAPAAAQGASPGEPKNLFELFAPVRGLLTDDEIDTLFARNRSMSRPVDLS